MLSGNYPITELNNTQKRKDWITTQLHSVMSQHADGFNIDIEDATRNGTSDTELLSKFVEEVYNAFKEANSDYQVISILNNQQDLF